MINVKICMGTACYIMGSAELLNFKEELTEEEMSLVKIEGSTCLGICNGYNPATPYAVINGDIIENATVDTLIEKVKELLKKTDNNRND